MKQATTPSRAKILLEKISKKIRRNTLASKSSKTKEIIRENKVDWEKYCKSTNKKIYKESKKFEAKLKNKSKKKLSKLDVNMGGGGNYVFYTF